MADSHTVHDFVTYTRSNRITAVWLRVVTVPKRPCQKEREEEFIFNEKYKLPVLHSHSRELMKYFTMHTVNAKIVTHLFNIVVYGILNY